jgi:hypothetical protein
MKSIQTKYLPATNTKPSRIKASAEGVKSEVWTCNELDDIRKADGLEHITNHQCAARIFAHLHKWGTALASGGLPDGSWAHCFVPDIVVQTIKLADTLFDTVSCSERFDGLRDSVKASSFVLR